MGASKKLKMTMLKVFLWIFVVVGIGYMNYVVYYHLQDSVPLYLGVAVLVAGGVLIAVSRKRKPRKESPSHLARLLRQKRVFYAVTGGKITLNTELTTEELGSLLGIPDSQPHLIQGEAADWLAKEEAIYEWADYFQIIGFIQENRGEIRFWLLLCNHRDELIAHGLAKVELEDRTVTIIQKAYLNLGIDFERRWV